MITVPWSENTGKLHEVSEMRKILGGIEPAPEGIIFGWGMAAQLSKQTTAKSLGEVQSQICGALLNVIRIFQNEARQPLLWLLTKGAVALPAVVNPAQTPLWGMGKALALELPGWAGSIDLDPAMPEPAVLYDVLCTADQEDQFALRDNKRYVCRLTTHQFNPSALHIDDGGAYLITGGCGALGLHTARFLVAHGAKNLVLVSRSGDRKLDAPARVVLKELEEKGAVVTILPVDVADEDAVNALFAEIRETMPPLKGIVHAAGTPGYHPLDKLSLEDFQKVMRPKLLGTWNLHRASLNETLDFFVCYSSISSVWGSLGQLHYAAANRFLDGLMSRRKDDGLPGLSINWGPWPDGMATEEARTRLATIGVHTLEADDYLETLAPALTEDVGQVVAARLDVARFKAVYEARKPKPFLNMLPHAEEGSAQAKDGDQPTRKWSPAEEAASLGEITARILGDVLGFPQLKSPHETRGFFEMGMDSLTAIEFRDRLAAKFGLALPGTLAFDFPNLKELTQGLTGLLEPTSAVAVTPAATLSAEPDKQVEESFSGALNTRLLHLESMLADG